VNEQVKRLAVDVGWGILWALMIVATVLFASGASEFIYIDF
jgi:hypothetical protein